jgi:hypothetical protein
MSDEDIKKIFTGELYWPLMNEYDDAAAKQMILKAQETYDRANKLVDRAEHWIVEVNAKAEKTRKDMESLQQENLSLKASINKLFEWRMFMFKLDSDFIPLTDEERSAMKDIEPKKKGLFSRRD